MDKPKNILFVALTRLGDMLQATPTIAGLKQEHPDCRITVLIEKNFSSVCHGIPGIDEVYEIDLGYIWQCIKQERESLVDAFEYVDQAVADLKAKKFDTCINISSSSYTSMFIKMLEIPDTRGWVADDEGQRLILSPWAMLFAAYVFHGNRDLNSLNIVDTFRGAAHVTQHPRRLQYKITERDREFPQEFFRRFPVQGAGPLIFLQAGASQEKRQWAPIYFAQLCRILVERLDARIVLTGTKSELPIIQMILHCYSSPNIVSAVGETSISQLAALLSQGALLVTGDTGTMHLGAAVGIPIVALFLASAFCFETGPYGEGHFVIQPQISCNPCNPNFSCARPDCHQQVSPQLVAYLAELRLNTTPGTEATIQIPDTIADPKSVIVYRSTFDNDGFIDFRPMNGRGEKGGVEDRHYIAARDGYRDLWKEEFKMAEAVQVRGSADLSPALREGLESIVRESSRGRELLRELDVAIRNPAIPAERLSAISALLKKIDKDIECLGVTHELFGPVIRMFVMEVQNMRGTDPLELASKMETIYATLERRIRKLGRLYAEHFEEASRN